MQRNRTDYCVVAEHVGAMKNRAFISVGIFMSASYNTPKQYGDEAMAAQFAQFAHIQTFSRKKNKAGQCVDQVIGELLREALYAAHVFEPAPPEVVDGISPEQLRAAHDAMVAAAQTQFRIKGEVRTRAVRQDRHTLVTAVASYPVPYAEIRGDPEKEKALKVWEEANVRFFKKCFGPYYRATYRHVDETYAHLHIHALPKGVPGIDAGLLHPGKAAKKKVETKCKADGMPTREVVKAGNQALKSAMRDWQDMYYRDVGEPCGLLRDGPRRRRLSRAQYQAEKHAAHLRSRSTLAVLHMASLPLEANVQFMTIMASKMPYVGRG